MKKILLYATLLCYSVGYGQMVPGEFEQINFLVTFSPESTTSWGDDDFTQTFFFVIPESFTKPVYLRVFDPGVGGKYDEKSGSFDSQTKFSIYGGKDAYSHPDARKLDPVGNYKSGTLLASKVFGNQSSYDDNWYTFGPLNPMEGEYVASMKSHVIKVITQGVKGNDGNLYKYFLSTQPDRNLEVEGANAFTYEYSFRLPHKSQSVSHLYPFITKDVVSITQHNFDLDKEGQILIYSVAKNRHKGNASANNTWDQSTHMIEEEEKNTSIDIQILKGRDSRNDMVCYVVNQYNEPVPFFSEPIGGPPKFKYKVKINFNQQEEGHEGK